MLHCYYLKSSMVIEKSRITKVHPVYSKLLKATNEISVLSRDGKPNVFLKSAAQVICGCEDYTFSVMEMKRAELKEWVENESLEYNWRSQRATHTHPD